MYTLSRNKVWNGVGLLFIAGLVGKVISAFYRVPLQNFTGDTGFYIYQQVYPLLGTATILALYGLPSAITQFYLEHPSEQNNRQTKKKIFISLAVFGTCIAVLLYWLSPVLSSWMKDETLTSVIRHTVWVFLFIPITALLRGMYQAKERFNYFAGSQVIEQIGRATLIITTSILIGFGIFERSSIGLGAAVGSVLGLMLAAIYLIIHKQKVFNESYHASGVTYKDIIPTIIGSGLIISMNHMLLLLMQMADAFTVVPGLLKTGISLVDATELKGVIDRGQPLLQLVTITGSSLVMALVPSVSKQHLLTERTRTIQLIQKAIHYCMYISIGATAGLIVLMPEINELFFQDRQGVFPLRILSIALLFSPVIIVVVQVLQGFGYRKWIAFIFFVGLWIKVILNYWLTPLLGTAGNALATVITLLAIFICVAYLLEHHLKQGKDFSSFRLPWIKISMAMFSMVGVLWLIQWMDLASLIHHRLILFLYVIGNVGIGAFVYGWMLYRLKVISSEDIKQVLGSRKER